MNPTPCTLGPLRLAALVTRGDPVNPHEFRTVWGGLRAAATERGLAAPGVRFLCAFGGTSLGLAGMRWYAAAIEVGAEVAIAPPLEEVRVPAGKYLRWTYVGGYEGLGAAWGEFAGRLAADGVALDLARPGVEIYADDGKAGGAPTTELYVPVA